MSLGAVNGSPVARMRMALGAFGCWWVDVDMVEAVELAGAATVTLADVTAQGTVISGGTAHGRAAYRIVGGTGGWGRALPPKPYHNDAGVKASLVLADAARECGETIGTVPARIMGPHFARVAQSGYELLNLLAPGAWYQDFAGAVQFGARPTTTYTGDGTRSRLDPAAGAVDVVADTIATLVPGVTVDGSAPATDVEYVLDESRLTVRVYARARAGSRQLAALRRVIAGLFPEARYRGLYEYRVTTQDGERLNLQPARVASGLPSLARVPVRPGMAGLRANVQLGSLVLVAFADADPSRPCVVAHDAPDAPGWMPLTLELGGPGALGVARMTDPVVAGPFGGTIVGASARVKAVL